MTRFELGEPDRAELSGTLLELVDEHLAERDSLEKITVMLIRENIDMLRVRRRQ